MFFVIGFISISFPDIHGTSGRSVGFHVMIVDCTLLTHVDHTYAHFTFIDILPGHQTFNRYNYASNHIFL